MCVVSYPLLLFFLKKKTALQKSIHVLALPSDPGKRLDCIFDNAEMEDRWIDASECPMTKEVWNLRLVIFFFCILGEWTGNMCVAFACTPYMYPVPYRGNISRPCRRRDWNLT